MFLQVHEGYWVNRLYGSGVGVWPGQQEIAEVAVQGQEEGTHKAATGRQGSGQILSASLECAEGPTQEASHQFSTPLWPGDPFPRERG